MLLRRTLLVCMDNVPMRTNNNLCGMHNNLPKFNNTQPRSFTIISRKYSTAEPINGEKKNRNGQVIVVTSGKGGVGKTTTAASFSYGLAEKGYKTCVIDFDIGLRNLDLHFGMERRVVFDFINVINEEASLRQALIKDRRCENLSMLAASQTRDKTALKMDGVEKVLGELRRDFDFIVCDSPAGIESGAHHAMYWSDEAIICTNPEISSVRDSDKMIGIIGSKSKRAAEGLPPVKVHLLITRYNPDRAVNGAMMSVNDIVEQLGVKLLGVVPESSDIMHCTNLGKPVILMGGKSDAAVAYDDMVDRFLGADKPMSFVTPKQQGWVRNLFSKVVNK